MKRLLGVCLLVCLATPAQAPASRAAASATCAPLHVSVDTTGARYSESPEDGRGWGQVVLTQDTIIVSITFWRRDTLAGADTRLFVTTVDSTGMPDVLNIVYTGPVFLVPIGDGVHASPVTFAFDPPLTLPGAGRYFFDVMPVSCPDFFILMADTTNRYPDGAARKTGKLCGAPAPGGVFPGTSPYLDLMFDAEFCDTHSTPTRRATWGELKTRYH